MKVRVRSNESLELANGTLLYLKEDEVYEAVSTYVSTFQDEESHDMVVLHKYGTVPFAVSADVVERVNEEKT